MKLYKMETNVISDVIDKVYILVDENTYCIGRYLAIFNVFRFLLPLQAECNESYA